MATLAKWGSTQFKVNADELLTFRNMKRTYSSRWVSHNVVGDRPKMEFMGPDMDQITIEVILDAEFGVNPRREMRKFREAAMRGEVNNFYVGGRKVSSHPLYIESGSEDWNEIWNQGELVRATASITFSEYR